jgi:hypothetical protein
LIKDFIKADLHVDTFSMDIQNIGKPNDLKVFGVGKSKGIKRIAKCRTC